MIYKCDRCNKEMKLMKGANYCPICGTEIKPIDLEEKVAELYNSGKTMKEISAELRMTDIVVDQVIAKAALNGKVKTDSLVQTEYETAILEMMDNNWDGRLKTIKVAMPEDCTYTTINYYSRKHKRAVAEARRIENEKRVTEIRKLLRLGTDVQTIADEKHVSVFMVERIMLEEIEKDKAVANAYINNDYKAQILDLINDPDWDGKLGSIKSKLPEDVTYTNIKATIAKNK